MSDIIYRNMAAGCLAFAVALVLAQYAGAAVYSGGDGKESDPYQVGDAADLALLCDTPSDWGRCFLLTADIDLDGASLTPIGNAADPFTGVFDGSSHIIRNGKVAVSGNEYVGLFGCLGTGSAVRNLGVEAVSVTGTLFVGGLAGYNEGGAVISCYTTGAVAGAAGGSDVGGLLGCNVLGSINSCYATGTVTGANCVGGLAGTNYGSIVSCSATGSVRGSGNVGGLVGANSSLGAVSSCLATATVTGTGGAVGGLAGINHGGIASCYASGNVAGSNGAGGLAGDNSGSITHCYATGKVTGNTDLGGLLGRSSGGAVIQSYWDQEASGLSASAGGEGRGTDAMTYPYAPDTYVDWDFVATWVADEGKDNDGYPYLRNCAVPEDSGICGCSGLGTKGLVPERLLKRALGDWLLVSVGVPLIR